MRVWPGVFLLVAACSSPSSPQPLTAESFRSDFIASFVTPTPATIAPGLDLPLHPGDRIIANCAQAYAHELPEMTIDERRAFNASVVCVYPQQEAFDESFAFYLRQLRERGFSDDSGTYVQSAMRIACNRTHSVAMSLQSRFIPPFVFDEATGEHIDIPGGGELANIAILFSVSDRPCEQ